MLPLRNGSPSTLATATSRAPASASHAPWGRVATGDGVPLVVSTQGGTVQLRLDRQPRPPQPAIPNTRSRPSGAGPGVPRFLARRVRAEPPHNSVVLPRAERVFGRLAISYVVEPRDAGRCRLVVCLSVTVPSSVLESARLTLLAFGDLLMMRKQLNTLKERAGRSARDRSVGERDFLAPGRGLPSRAKGDRVNSPAGGLLRTQRKDARIMPMLARGISHDSRWPTLPLPSGLPRKPF